MIGGGGSRASSGGNAKASIPSVPGLDSFDRQTMDVWTNGGSFPPTTGQRATGLPILVTGTFLEGSYSRAQLEFGYTHAVLSRSQCGDSRRLPRQCRHARHRRLYRNSCGTDEQLVASGILVRRRDIGI